MAALSGVSAVTVEFQVKSFRLQKKEARRSHAPRFFFFCCKKILRGI